MTKRKVGATRIPCGLAVAAVLGLGALAGIAHAAGPVTPELTPRLHELLQKEMQGISQAMEKILHGLVEGDHEAVAANAERIHASFILKQELTPEDKKDLQAAVPGELVRMDRAFHQKAKRLAHVAKEKKADLELYYFGRMVEDCQGCHGRFVGDRFPGFGEKRFEGDHDH